MKTILSLVLAVFLTGPKAFAEVYECRTIPQEDPWTGLGGEGSDIWYAVIDLDNGTVAMDSENEIFGENPFSVLKEGSAKGYVKGTRIFVGKNKYDKTNSYELSFANGQASLSRQEGPGAGIVIDAMECKQK